MSKLSEVALMIPFFLLGLFVYAYMDRWIQAQADAVVSGLARGVPVPAVHRRMMLDVRWFVLCFVQTTFQGTVSIGWWLSARNASTEDARLFAYLVCFLFLGVAIGWLIYIPIFYLYFKAIVRQAEAD
jgi:hypothetical protein